MCLDFNYISIGRGDFLTKYVSKEQKVLFKYISFNMSHVQFYGTSGPITKQWGRIPPRIILPVTIQYFREVQFDKTIEISQSRQHKDVQWRNPRTALDRQR